jgi:hypothetical protein
VLRVDTFRQADHASKRTITALVTVKATLLSAALFETLAGDGQPPFFDLDAHVVRVSPKRPNGAVKTSDLASS